jgi:hypothetical protein
MKELIEIQSKLKAPKNQRNDFGKYNYRSLEDIQEALKPLLKEHKCFITVCDEIVLIGDRYYVKATATLQSEGGTKISNVAYAREPENKKGMDESQITGATSSYARKYALNGLFAIDDTKDADATNTHQDEVKPQYKTISKASEEDLNAYKKEFAEICKPFGIVAKDDFDDLFMWLGWLDEKERTANIIKCLKHKVEFINQLETYKEAINA